MKQLIYFFIGLMVLVSFLLVTPICIAGNVSITGAGTGPKTGDATKLPTPTPSGPDIVPIPYPNTGSAADGTTGTKKVNVTGSGTSDQSGSTGSGN